MRELGTLVNRVFWGECQAGESGGEITTIDLAVPGPQGGVGGVETAGPYPDR